MVCSCGCMFSAAAIECVSKPVVSLCVRTLCAARYTFEAGPPYRPLAWFFPC